MTRRLLVISTAMLVAAAASSCDDSSSDDTPMIATGISKADYIRKADAICRRFNAKFGRLQNMTNRSLDLPPTPANDQYTASLLNQTATVVSQQVTGLQRLVPPKGDEVPVQRFLDSLDEQQRLISQQALAISGGDYDTSATIRDQLDEAQARGTGLAQGYGFKYCA